MLVNQFSNTPSSQYWCTGGNKLTLLSCLWTNRDLDIRVHACATQTGYIIILVHFNFIENKLRVQTCMY